MLGLRSMGRTRDQRSEVRSQRSEAGFKRFTWSPDTRYFFKHYFSSEFMNKYYHAAALQCFFLVICSKLWHVWYVMLPISCLYHFPVAWPCRRHHRLHWSSLLWLSTLSPLLDLCLSPSLLSLSVLTLMARSSVFPGTLERHAAPASSTATPLCWSALGAVCWSLAWSLLAFTLLEYRRRTPTSWAPSCCRLDSWCLSWASFWCPLLKKWGRWPLRECAAGMEVNWLCRT